MWQIIKDLLKDDAFFFTLLIVLVGAASFGLGRQSAEELPLPSEQAAALSASAAQETEQQVTKPPTITSTSAAATSTIQLVA